MKNIFLMTYFPVRLLEESSYKGKRNCVQWGTVILLKSTSCVSMIKPQCNFGKYHNEKKKRENNPKQPIKNSENARNTGSPQLHCRANRFRSLTLAMSSITIELNKGSLLLSLLNFSKIFNAIIIHLGKTKGKPQHIKYIFFSYLPVNNHHCMRNEGLEEGYSTTQDSLMQILHEACVYRTQLNLWGSE